MPTRTKKLVFDRWVEEGGKTFRVTEDDGGNVLSREEVKPRKPAVTVTGKWVAIKTEWHRKRHDAYEFTTDRIATPLKLVGWLYHLSEKIWFDPETERELIDKVCRHFGWDHWNA